MRIVTGAIVHETSTFTPVATTEESFFERFGVLKSEEIIDAFRGTNTPTGGFIDGAEAIDDADGHILAAVRRLVGPRVPIVVQLDIHSNVSRQMVEMADVLIGRETYPDVDMAERGRECTDVLVRMLEEGLRPTMALAQIPMMWGMNQVTDYPPMSEAIAELHRIEAQVGVI